MTIKGNASLRYLGLGPFYFGVTVSDVSMEYVSHLLTKLLKRISIFNILTKDRSPPINREHGTNAQLDSCVTLGDSLTFKPLRIW